MPNNNIQFLTNQPKREVWRGFAFCRLTGNGCPWLAGRVINMKFSFINLGRLSPQLVQHYFRIIDSGIINQPLHETVNRVFHSAHRFQIFVRMLGFRRTNDKRNSHILQHVHFIPLVLLLAPILLSSTQITPQSIYHLFCFLTKNTSSTITLLYLRRSYAIDATFVWVQNELLQGNANTELVMRRYRSNCLYLLRVHKKTVTW